MRDKDLYQQILGLKAPWVVESVELNKEKKEVVVKVGLKGSIILCCPECGKPMPGYDQRERSWRHLDTCQFTTILTAAVPRGNCEEHGVRQIGVPWAERGSQFTALFEAFAINVIKEMSRSGAAELLRLSWCEVDGIMRRAVERGIKRRKFKDIHLLGIDEKAFRKGQDYVTVVCDIESGSVLYVGDDRTTNAIDGFYEGLTSKEREEIYAVAMDMWEPYIQSTKDKAPNAEIVFDKFHVAQHLTDAVDKVRRRENKKLRREGDERLVGTRYRWLVNPKRMLPEQRISFRELRDSNLKTARAWAIKETAARLWNYVYVGSARRFFKRWYNWAIRSRLEPVKKVARMIKRRLDNILTYLRIPITNAVVEGINSKIQWIKQTARGFRSRENFKTAILFHCGKLNLYPHGI
jgi:transposase